MDVEERADLWMRLARLRMLVIVQDWWIRDSLYQYFDTYGCTIKSFDNGREGIEALSRHSFDIIIADHNISDMSGMDFFRGIKMSHPESVKILIMATCDRDCHAEALKLGIHKIIEKPFTTKTIDDALTQVFTEKRKFPPEQ